MALEDTDSLIGRTLGHYRILSKLGAGGMGVVFRARDERLERDVALKILSHGALANDEARKRFRREALAVSRLNHPSIGTIHDFNSQDGVDFLVMELVTGGTLADRIRGGPLPEFETASLGAQIAEALEAAHAEGVIHRDLKPANILVTASGRIKVLDFGLAALLESDDDRLPAPSLSQSLTATQTVLGTLPYMSPEQLLGERADARTDLYALGVILFEMGAGRRPFDATAPGVLVTEILQKSPPQPRTFNPRLSTVLEGIILHLLAKPPEERYASAHDVAVDLRRISAERDAEERFFRPTERPAPEPAAPPTRAIAVLPLENLSGDPQQEYFADGMTEALIADLAQIEALRVISRTSVAAYKRARKPLPEIARELRVDFVVEGSVLRSGDRVRITAQLIEARTDQNAWARSYERDLGDVLAIQGEVARTIAQEIRVKLTPQEDARLGRARSVPPEALEAYLKGRYHWNRRTREALREAIACFEAAIANDPAYALAYAGLSDCHQILADMGAVRARDASLNAEAAARRALELDDNLAEAHASLAHVWMHQGRWTDAEREFRRSLELNPSYAVAHGWYALVLGAQERHEESLAEVRRARELDPLATSISVSLGFAYYRAGRYQEAAEHLRGTIALNPDYPDAHRVLAFVLVILGRFLEADAELEEWLRGSGEDPETSLDRAYVEAMAGRPDIARAILARVEGSLPDTWAPSYSIAIAYASLGERDPAFAWLERAVEEWSPQLTSLKSDPRFRKLRSDSRFAGLLEKIGLAPQPMGES